MDRINEIVFGEAKGSFQRAVAKKLITFSVIENPLKTMIGGRNKWFNSYMRSFCSYLDRLNYQLKPLARVWWKPGKYGGLWSAKFALVRETEVENIECFRNQGWKPWR